MNTTKKQRKARQTWRKSGFSVLCIMLILLTLVQGLFSIVARAEITGTLEPGTKTYVSRTRSSLDPKIGYAYHFDDYGPANLPDAFGQVRFDTSDPSTYSVHGDRVNYYYTTGNRAVYCFEPSNPYVDVEDGNRDEYYVNAQPSSQAMSAITQEQRDMLGYVLAEGVSEYIGGSKPVGGVEVPVTENPDQIATQLAVWMIGAGLYEGHWFDDLLPAGDDGIAPNAAICTEARRLILAALARVREKPSFIESEGFSSSVEMEWDDVASNYKVTLVDTKGNLKNDSDWGRTIVSALAAKNLTGTIDDAAHSLTITGDPTVAGKKIDFIFETKKIADIVFLESPILEGQGSTHYEYKIRQQMISINFKDVSIEGSLRLWRKAPTEITVPVWKTVEGTGAPAQTFTFTLTELASATPTDIKAGGESRTVTVPGTGAGDFTSQFSEIEYRRVGTYWYKVEETSGGGLGWVNDSGVYVVTVVVSGNPLAAEIQRYSMNTSKFTNRFASISTTAKNAADDSHTAQPVGEVTIVDTVEYRNLIPGTEYTLKGVLMDKSTNATLLVGEDNEEVRAEVKFTPISANGTVDMTFVLEDASELVNKTVVVFEYLYLGETYVTEHADIDDSGQSISFGPKIGTKARDKDTDTQEVEPNAQVTIVDTVSYEGLTVGETYTVKGTLYDKSTTAPLLIGGYEITAERTFVAETANGTVTLEFTFDASALEGKTLVVFEKLFQGNTEIATHTDINDKEQTIEVKPKIRIGTKARDKDTGTQEVEPNENVTIVDTVSYEGLTVGETYTIKGKLYEKSTNTPLLIGGNEVTAEKTFEAETANGTVTLEFTFNASALAGKTVVVFEGLFQNSIEIATHADIDDDEQAVKVKPKVRTRARDKDTDTQEVRPNEQVTIVDTVSYEGLIVGETYTVKGKLYDKETGDPLLVDGNEVTAEKTFEAETANGTVTLEFTFDASALVGKTLVVFERLFQGNTEVAAHADINDEEQSVKVRYKIRTRARNKDTGTQEVEPDAQVTIVDSVSYEGLIVGKTYTVKGKLYDKSTGAPLLVDGNEVTAEKTFEADKTDGTVELEFTFNASALAGKTVVVFEKLFQDDKEVATHEDLEDEEQAVTVKPKIRTRARDKDTGTQKVKPDENVTIVDTVSYEGLTVGKTYTVKGKLYDKGTGAPLLVGGNEVTAEKTFVAETANGTVTLEFTFNASALAGKTLVVFEKLFLDDKEIVSHEDINDSEQTVTVETDEGPGKASSSKSSSSKKSSTSGNTTSPSSTPKGTNIDNDFTTTNPKTGDAVYISTFLFVLALLGFSVIVLSKRRKLKAK